MTHLFAGNYNYVNCDVILTKLKVVSICVRLCKKDR